MNKLASLSSVDLDLVIGGCGNAKPVKPQPCGMSLGKPTPGDKPDLGCFVDLDKGSIDLDKGSFDKGAYADADASSACGK